MEESKAVGAEHWGPYEVRLTRGYAEFVHMKTRQVVFKSSHADARPVLAALNRAHQTGFEDGLSTGIIERKKYRKDVTP